MRHQSREGVDAPPRNGQVVEPSAQQRHGKPGVLVVDDDRLVRLLVQLGLERNGFDVWLAPTGREAIELYQEEQERIAVVLLDVRMPGLDGPATLDALRALNPDVPACFMTGDSGKYEPEELLQRGAAHVVGKPFHLDHLAEILRLLAQGVPADLLQSK